MAKNPTFLPSIWSQKIIDEFSKLPIFASLFDVEHYDEFADETHHLPPEVAIYSTQLALWRSDNARR